MPSSEPNAKNAAISTENSNEAVPYAWLKPYQFPPKVSGNPSGRPKKHLTEAMRRKLDNDPERAERIAEQMLAQAEAGDVQSFDRVRDSIEGKPAQSVNINGDIDITVTDRRIRVAEVLSRLAGETER